MRIEGCEFPDDRLYDADGFVWIRPESPSEIRLGITSILAAVGGRLTKAIARPAGTQIEAGHSVGSIESGKYFGTVRTPVAAVVLEANPLLVARPRVVSEVPYSDGWFARLRPTAWDRDRAHVASVRAAENVLRMQIATLKVRCFAAFPDYELFEIGTECAAVLAKLEDLLRTIEVGEVVHIVSDDRMAPIEMANWSDRTGHPVVDSREEGNLFHFLIRRAR
jgi:glycine cleavage system H lipoate-binding protein/TusA-related sulfurtransferase